MTQYLIGWLRYVDGKKANQYTVKYCALKSITRDEREKKNFKNAFVVEQIIGKKVFVLSTCTYAH
jgi:hypothetical protein